MGINLTPEEKFEVFGDNDPEQYAAGGRAALGRHRGVRRVAAPRGLVHQGGLAADPGRGRRLGRAATRP